jgi:hypothetical protein
MRATAHWLRFADAPNAAALPCSITASHLLQEEFMELFRPFAARDRLLKSIQDFEDRLTTCLRDE